MSELSDFLGADFQRYLKVNPMAWRRLQSYLDTLLAADAILFCSVGRSLYNPPTWLDTEVLLKNKLPVGVAGSPDDFALITEQLMKSQRRLTDRRLRQCVHSAGLMYLHVAYTLNERDDKRVHMVNSILLSMNIICQRAARLYVISELEHMRRNLPLAYRCILLEEALCAAREFSETAQVLEDDSTLDSALGRFHELNPELHYIVWLYSEEFRALVVEASSLEDMSSLDINDYENDEPPWVTYATSAEQEVVDMSCARENDEPPVSRYAMIYANHGLVSGTFYPLYVRGTCRGVVGCFRTRPGSIPHEFSAFRDLVLREIVRHVAHADQLRLNVQTKERLRLMMPLLAIGRESAQRMHDIRDNLTSLKGLLIELRDSKQTRTSRHFVESRCVNGIAILERMKDTLSTQLSSFRKAREKRTRTELREWLTAMDAKLRLLAATEGVTYELNIPERPIVCSVQQFYMARALENLVSNGVYFAKRFARQGRPFVRITVVDTHEWIAIKVLDSGPGIQQKPIEKIFEEGESTRPGGYGVGLPIVKSIIEDHRGKIEVENDLRFGACITIYLPHITA